MKLRINFHESDCDLPVLLKEEEHLPLHFDGIYPVAAEEHYTGPCSVAPRTFEQVLYTAEKLMKQDIVILEIPYASVANESGGVTVTIGGI